VHLEIIDDEAVVTSLVRRAMPVVRYRTGDRVEWLSTDCPCGSREPRFRLLGRLDGLMNIWGCRVAYDDVERALVEAGVQSPVRQLILREADDPSAQLEQMVVRLEQTAAGPEFLDRFLAGLYRYSGDLSVALDVGALRKRVVIECVPPGTIPRIARTGKIRPIIDERTSGRV
jgi:phenylacetate-CoA ligase